MCKYKFLKWYCYYKVLILKSIKQKTKESGAYLQ